MRFRLRTLLIVLALGPPVLGWSYSAYREWRDSMYHMEVDPSGEVIRIIDDPTGRVLAEHHVGHISFGEPASKK